MRPYKAFLVRVHEALSEGILKDFLNDFFFAAAKVTRMSIKLLAKLPEKLLNASMTRQSSLCNSWMTLASLPMTENVLSMVRTEKYLVRRWINRHVGKCG